MEAESLDEDVSLVGSEPINQPTRDKKSGFVASIGNFSIQYNFGCATIAVQFMNSHQDKREDGMIPDYPQPDWAQHTLLGTVFLGTIFGMLFMGYLGDALSNKIAMNLTLSLTLIGALGGSLFSIGDSDSVYLIICICRFILGFGVGGIYPLSATRAASESTTRLRDTEMVKDVAWAFAWQVPGAIVPYAVAIVLLLPGMIFPSTLNDETTTWQFRCMLGLGSLPAAIVLWANIREQQADPEETSHWKSRKSLIQELKENKKHWKMLFATSATWFFYDVAVYGTFTFTPMILDSIFGKGETLFDDMWRSVVVSSFGIPALLLTILLLDRLSLRKLNLLGFLFSAIVYGAMAYAYHEGADARILFTIFCLISFGSNLGLSVATFVTPAVAFPTDVTSTFHGISSASAKLGAAVGTFLHPALKVWGGVTAVMLVQCGVSLIGCFISLSFMRESAVYHASENHLRNPLLDSAHAIDDDEL